MIYLSYNYFVETAPNWISVFKEYCDKNSLECCVANDFSVLLKDNLPPVKESVSLRIRNLNLDQALLDKTDSILSKLESYIKFGVNEQTTDPIFFNLYMLIRSDYLIMSQNSKTEPHDLIIANLLGIPSVCITDSFILNPYSVYYSSVITQPVSVKGMYDLLEGINGNK